MTPHPNPLTHHHTDPQTSRGRHRLLHGALGRLRRGRAAGGRAHRAGRPDGGLDEEARHLRRLPPQHRGGHPGALALAFGGVVGCRWVQTLSWAVCPRRPTPQRPTPQPHNPTHKKKKKQNATLAAAGDAGAQASEAIAAAVDAAAATNLSSLADLPGFALPGSDSDFSYIPTPADIVAGAAAGGGVNMYVWVVVGCMGCGLVGPWWWVECGGCYDAFSSTNMNTQ